MSIRITRALAVLGASALLVPAAAVAAKPSHAGSGKGKAEHAQSKSKSKARSKSQGKGKRKGHTKPRTFVFKGVAVNDGSSNTVTVRVVKGNKAARSFKGEEVTFDLSSAKLRVADTNGDGQVTADDVKAGDKVVVQARLPRSARPDGSTIRARKLVDQTNPPVEQTETAEQPAEPVAPQA